ncbi:hypothetical protein N7509_010886 [Penicillium cosmopolitanum]|uniref:AGC-kinase C-terminal domain-containing protein n=1 Tax=Penicillium cosmopolitanum TaxID=1131564 RepID=A0A9W9VSH4_9EURO|nr:uncharacterized protein N7509_010886 [Penicillium cosmopolitanum]KAJ5388345.1 hypothetical protein N7509_010886 [Penicillium cosmopolitanum]
MPPSTVFSYWRRDHRRSTAPPVSSPASSPGLKGPIDSPLSTPPQLPQIPDTPILTTPFDERSPYDAPPWADLPLENDASKLNFSSSVAPLSSSVSLAVHHPSLEKEDSSHPSLGEHGPVLEPESEPAWASQQNTLQPSGGVQRPEGDGDSNFKPTSPFRPSFGGKGTRSLQTPTGETQKRSPTAGPGTNHFRMMPSPEDLPVDKSFVPPRDIRSENAMVRRTAERDVPVDNAHHKSGKAMLHLLNPMSLLARRRSAQMSNNRTDEVKHKSSNLVPAIPDDYDPRIRGSIVHDFSAPRPRRNVSGTQSGPPDGASYSAQDASPSQPTLQSPASRLSDQTRKHSDHSPVFKEHFEDDQNALQVENKGYLQSSLLTNQAQLGNEKSLPPFARNLPYRLPDQSTENVEPSVSPPIELPAEHLAELYGDIPETPPKTSPPPPQQDDDIIPIIPRPSSSGLPKHLKSNASRFSFDMGGVESSTQEKLLEEKHKAKEAERKMEDGYFDDFDEDFDQDMIDDIDGLEERIPGVNADADEDYFSAPSMAEIKSWTAPGLSPVVASPITPAPPGLPPTSIPPEDQKTPSPDLDEIEQPREDDIPPPLELRRSSGIGRGPPDQSNRVIDEEDDDLYFDDGEFGDLDSDDQDGGFDESIFDDETSHLYERKPVAPPAAPPQQKPDPSGDALEREILLEEHASQGLKHMPSVASEYQAPSIKRGPLGEPIPNMGPTRAHGGVLTEQNLDLLHNALAFAANEASVKSQFERKFSTSERSQAQESLSQASHTGESQPGLVSDDSQVVDMAAYEDPYDDHAFEDDDSYYDDAIVAAANAEALENDDEGFYGQEFGFYAQAHGASELTNGGYFGPRGVEGISRSFSSRGKFQEPSLTPITERSEWSTRNSMISLKAHGAAHSNPSLASPGLAQLADMGNLDDEMTLSALMKLRRGAWGGSNGSLRSSASSPPPHTLPSSNRASFAEASPIDARPTAEEGSGGISSPYNYPPDESHTSTASPLKGAHLGHHGHLADLPSSGTDGSGCPNHDGEMPTTGGPQRFNLL